MTEHERRGLRDLSPAVRAIAERRGQPALICVPLVGRDEAALQAELDFVLPQCADLIEWRIDHFLAVGDLEAVIRTGRMIRNKAAAVPLLLTCRSTREGGQSIALSDKEVVLLYSELCRAGCVDLVDVEMDSDVTHLLTSIESARAMGIGVVLSWHDFHSTPAIELLAARFQRAFELGADVAKVAVMPLQPDDVLTLLAATAHSSRTLPIPLVSMSMGALGALSRIAGWMFGSAVTFAAGRNPSAPGQLSVSEVRQAMRLLAGQDGCHVVGPALQR